MYKVFLNNTLIIFSKSIDLAFYNPDKHNIATSNYANLFSELEHQTEKPNYEALWFISDDPQNLKRQLLEDYYLYQAAGGVVFSPDNRVLVIFRRGRWDLPKGKLDPEETLQECALREVTEETGIIPALMDASPFLTEHIYSESGIKIIKETSWYLMSCKNEDRPLPQEIEDITEARWVDKSFIQKTLIHNTYPSITSTLNHFGMI